MPATLRALAVATTIAWTVQSAGAASGSVPRVTKIDIDLTVDPGRGTLAETVELVVDAAGITQLRFLLDGSLVVKASRTDSGVIEHRQAGDALIVDVDPPFEGPRTLTFTIAGKPSDRAASEIGPRRVLLAPSMPWYPALPAFWAESSIVVRVPEGWTAVAPGRSTAPSRWTSRAPVRSLAVAAAPGVRSAGAPMIGTSLVLASDDASAASAKTTAARLVPGLAWLSGALAPYPFESFNLVMLPGFAGRIEASGMAVIGRDAAPQADADGADLLAGQWFGQRLAGDGAWIGAFAAWQACVFSRDRALALPGAIAAERAAYFTLRSGDVAIAAATAAAPPAVVRGKGSAAPDMIRLIAGDEATFDAIRELFTRPPGDPLSLAALRATIEKHAGRSLARVFEDWFERPGAPEIVATLRSFPASGGGFRADVGLVQKRALYALPVDVVIHGAAGEHRETIDIADETTSAFYVVPFEPKRIEIDPQNRLFRWK